jgi:CHAT domain-containing protein
LQREHPDYQKLSGATVPTLPAIQAQLQPGEALVTFLFGRSHGYALLVRREGVWLSRVNESQASLEAAITRLRAGLAVEGTQIGRFDARLAHALHESLLGGLSEGLAGVQHLVVAQSGALASLPFGVLLQRAPAGDDYATFDWLAARVALSTVPGVRAFHAVRHPPARRAPLALLGVGDPLIGQAAPGAESLATLCRGAGPAPQSALQALPRLPDTALELQRIRERLGASTPSRLLLGAEATEASLRQIALDQYRVVYFASHAVLPGELKCHSEPALVLTPPAHSTQRENDGLLDASEIARLRLQADLVVLSACNTAGAQTGLGGEAFSGLAQAFFQAGTRALVASHWQVPSAATRQLMETLFAGLGPHIEGDTARALQQAQRQLMANPATAHPLFWGAFVVVGDGRIAPATRMANQEAR